ncbi:peptidylprolyl isomerase [Bremerella sp. JC770]|uniref:peptidylprolyl isomerase n=1 Tax=Bremerella sp. JC770 TaxID=3232137 RepID=UPI00345B2CEC
MKFPHLSSSAAVIGLAVCLGLFTVGCGSSDSANPPAVSINDPGADTADPTSHTVSTDAAAAAKRSDLRGEEYPEVILTTSNGEIHLKLDAKKAPATVDNFLTNYIAHNHYDGTIFHYVQPKGMILGGLFDADMNPRETKSEIQNEAMNGLKNKRGTIAMSRDPSFIHSSTCQFFINCADNTAFDHIGTDDSSSFGYCVFGEVIEGMDVVDAISAVDVQSSDGFVNLPRQPVQILSARRVK